MQDVDEIKLLLDSRIPLLVIETYEEKKALDVLLKVANKHGKDLHRWSLTDGLSRLNFGPQLVPKGTELNEAEEMLRHVKQQSQPAMFALCDIHPFLVDQPQIVRLLKDIALNHFAIPHTLVFLSHQLRLPPELSRYSASYALTLPDDDKIMEIIREEAKDWSDRHASARVKTDNITLKKLVNNLQGMNASDVRRLVRGAIWNDGSLNEDDLPRINKAKFALLDMEGVVSFEQQTEDFSNVGGLHNLKRWLLTRRDAFNDDDSKLDRPKGILLLGVQGGGKSLAAKAVAGLWGLPLMRMDVGALYNKFHGETERNLREALKLADAMSPCVLWLDEIEKGMAQDGNDNGVSQRLLGSLLTWMAERRTRVFIVATSNDISRLPPELIRKGRLDEIFFVDLPEPAVRKDIFSIHLRKRDCAVANFDLEQLSAATQGFSGSEIEQAIIAALYSAAAEAKPLTTEILLREITATSPLSVVMAEQITQLRIWAEDRTIPA
ncbi:AAA family ATPase [Cellvibrio sp. KY-GH-1]|uniref:AAA family ATPase n=1 Tax=Cellvibrio sp. KY-GH-1 TaxID=2303332 RepID=UPI0012479B83|nr:AAA family ATPase [Cellvibrio sp. KY-GH-1]QEY18656.1 AAA family ATPase [Cellvibrio sp. KY-GH-1]